MAVLSVRLLGKFSIWRNDTEVSGLEAARLREMLSYILIYRTRPHSRESLASLLWGDHSTAQSKKYLRQALWHLQSALQDDDSTHENSLLSVDSEWVKVNSVSTTQLDVALFEEAFSRAQGVPGHALDAGSAGKLKEAARLYRGDLLEGCYQDWCIYERERLQNIFLMMLDKLMSYCEAAGECEEGLSYGDRILRLDRAREHTHRRLMRLYYMAGNRTSALRQYKRCVAALAEELGVKPARKTVELYEQICADKFIPPTLPQEALLDSADQATSHLSQIRSFLIDLREQIHEQIQAVEKNLKGR